MLCVCVPPGIVCTCSGIAAFTHGPIHEISVRIASVGRGGSAQSALCARACVCVRARACVCVCDILTSVFTGYNNSPTCDVAV